MTVTLERSKTAILTANRDRGLALLDEKIPGWWRLDADRPVRTEWLNLYVPDRCVVGQLFGGEPGCFTLGLQALGLYAWESAGDPIGSHGFGAADSMDDYPELTMLWREAIVSRRALAT